MPLGCWAAVAAIASVTAEKGAGWCGAGWCGFRVFVHAAAYGRVLFVVPWSLVSALFRSPPAEEGKANECEGDKTADHANGNAYIPGCI